LGTPKAAVVATADFLATRDDGTKADPVRALASKTRTADEWNFMVWFGLVLMF